MNDLAVAKEGSSREPRAGKLLLSKVALGLLLRRQGMRVRREVPVLPEPEGARSGTAGEATGAPVLRLLVLGDSAAAGVGVAQQRDGLAAQIASGLAVRMRGPVRWQLVARTGMTAWTARWFVAGAALQPADVVVCSLGGNEAMRQTRPRAFLASYRQLVAEVTERTGARLVVINGVPPMHILPALPQPLRWYLGQCAWRLDGALRRWAETDAGLLFSSLQWADEVESLASDRFHPGPAKYTRWAGIVAEAISQRWALP